APRGAVRRLWGVGSESAILASNPSRYPQWYLGDRLGLVKPLRPPPGPLSAEQPASQAIEVARPEAHHTVHVLAASLDDATRALNCSEPLDEDDERWVDLNPARGDHARRTLA